MRIKNTADSANFVVNAIAPQRVPKCRDFNLNDGFAECLFQLDTNGHHDICCILQIRLQQDCRQIQGTAESSITEQIGNPNWEMNDETHPDWAETVLIGTTKGGATALVSTGIASIVSENAGIQMRPRPMGGTAQYISVVNAGELEFGTANAMLPRRFLGTTRKCNCIWCPGFQILF